MDQNTETSKSDELPAETAKRLRGDIRDFMLDRYGLLDKPWTKMSQLEQQRLIDAVDEMARQVIRRVVDVVANYDWPTVAVRFAGKGTFEGGEVALKVTTGLSADNLTKLATGGPAMLVMVDPAQFFGQRRPARTEPDQPAMDLGEDESVDPETGEIRTTAEEGIPLDEAEGLFTAANEKAAEKKATRGRKKAGDEMPAAPARETADA